MRLVLLILAAWLLFDVLLVAGLQVACRAYRTVWRARVARTDRYRGQLEL